MEKDFTKLLFNDVIHLLIKEIHNFIKSYGNNLTCRKHLSEQRFDLFRAKQAKLLIMTEKCKMDDNFNYLFKDDGFIYICICSAKRCLFVMDTST